MNRKRANKDSESWSSIGKGPRGDYGVEAVVVSITGGESSVQENGNEGPSFEFWRLAAQEGRRRLAGVSDS
jgi:hypothetical protein